MHAYHPSVPTLIIQECGLCVPFSQIAPCFVFFFPMIQGWKQKEKKSEQTFVLSRVLSCGLQISTASVHFGIESTSFTQISNPNPEPKGEEYAKGLCFMHILSFHNI
jgi:hypothetical protein